MCYLYLHSCESECVQHRKGSSFEMGLFTSLMEVWYGMMVYSFEYTFHHRKLVFTEFDLFSMEMVRFITSIFFQNKKGLSNFKKLFYLKDERK